ncbi:MAG TPA: flagellar basal body rod protein FlgC [Thermodesulfobacteriota bacterium]|nr:flagellar basal body rod protein FlgC [Thermodesulfobacteriota bacterium]
MDLFHSMKISASALDSQRTVLRVLAENMANAQTTRTEEGGPYLRKKAVLSSSPVAAPGAPFAGFLSRSMGEKAQGSKVAEIVEDPNGVKTVFDPSHPDADESGLVRLPNVNMMEEMVALLAASRVFEANVTAFNSAKSMALRSLDIGRQ